MTRILISRNKEKQIVGFEAKGHTGFADAGQDIVCAAVSVLTQTVALGLMEVLGIEGVDLNIDEGWLRCKLPSDISSGQRKEAQILLNTMVIGLLNMMSNYSPYIEIKEREVE